MKKKIIISINPEFVGKIMNGTKKFEYRTKAAKNDIDKIIIYETYPIKKVVAEVEILGVLKMSPENLLDANKNKSGITKQFFDEYFKGGEVAYAYKLWKKVYDIPKDLAIFGLKSAPQSFVYID